MTARQRLLDALHGAGSRVENGGRSACCPAHADSNASLTIGAMTRSGPGVVVKCHAGCHIDDVLTAIGLTRGDLFDEPRKRTERPQIVATYDYCDEQGSMLFQKVRMEPKTFRQRHREGRDWQWSLNGTRRVLYRLPELLATDGPVYLCEGEKDADAMTRAGVTATTWTEGAWRPENRPKWRTEYTQALTGRDVVIVRDRDDPGRHTAATIAHLLEGTAASVRIVEAAEGKDAADHLAAGRTVAELVAVIVDAPQASPDTPHSPQDTPRARQAPERTGWGDEGLRSHQRLAARFATYADGRVLYVDGTGWHHWDGARWALDRRDAKVNALLKSLLKISWAEAIDDRNLESDVRASMTATGSAGVLSLASRDPRLLAVDVDPDPWLLNCRNGTLDLRSLELRPHDPADHITKITRAAYRPGARSSTWDEFLASSLPDEEVRGFLQRYAGLALVGRVLEHVLIIATGTGRNGKGVLSGALSNALGDYAVTASNDLLVAGRYGSKSAGELAAQMALRGARWAVMSELNKGDKLAEATMKHLTGGDPITAKLMGQNFVEFRPSHSFFMLTNDLPEVAADSKAVWARLRVVPFEVSFEGREDVTLEERLEAAADAILTWAADGLRAYHTDGLAAPPAVLARTAEYRTDNDPVRRFISECCEISPDLVVTTGALHAAYSRWAGENREIQLSTKAFGTQVKTLPGVAEARSRNARKWQGVGLIEEDPTWL